MALSKNGFREQNHNWRGGRSIASNGYILIRMPDHPLADTRGYVYEHRLVAEQKIGSPLQSGEQIHHKDGNKQNNHPDNLEVMPSFAHHRLVHRTAGKSLRLPGEDNLLIECACGCGIQLAKYDESGRPRKYVQGHNTLRKPLPEDNPIVECACGCGTKINKYNLKLGGRLTTYAQGHRKSTRYRGPNVVVECDCGCGTRFNKYDSSGRSRKFVSGHNGRSKINVRQNRNTVD